MKKSILVIFCSFLSILAFSQTDELFQMKKGETKNIKVNQTFTADTLIPIHSIEAVSSLSISGKVKLVDHTSLVRVILVTQKHELLVYETYTLISDKLEFSVNKFCDESSLIEDEIPIELIVIVRNAKFELESIHFSEEKLTQFEKTDFTKDTKHNKILVEKYKASKINSNNAKKSRTWLADTTTASLYPYELKNNMFGGSHDFITGGFEYYSDGIFSFEDFNPESNINSLKSVQTSTIVPEFDWRNRHGKDWITKLQSQGSCGSCWAFAAIGVTEAMMNIYYNNDDLDLDLSEQHIVSCNTLGCSCAVGGFVMDAFAFIHENGVTTENCYPYTGVDGTCSPTCNSEMVSIGSYTSWSGNMDYLKTLIINKGPLAIQIRAGWDHAMTLVGFREIQDQDYVKYITTDNGIVDSQIIAPNNLIGQTCLIFKNSSQINGYVYAFITSTSYMDSYYSVNDPSSSNNYTKNCTDADTDGYALWGGGSKPSYCPCSSSLPDGDDSDPNFGAMDSYGNCLPLEITQNYTWTTTRNICGGGAVKSGGNLTLTGATVNLPLDGEFKVELGGTLQINYGTIQ